MIQNEHQYKVTQTKLRELEQALIDLDINSGNLSSRLAQAEKKGIQVLIDRLRLEIIEYDNLKQQKTPIQVGSIEDLAIGLIKARISVGMTQKELAAKIGVQEQQIQRYEADRYASASLARLTEVARALEIIFDRPVEFQMSFSG
ncbi:helix-turn-helix transcriptional regulator [Chamaesiphon sp. OTE_75_metabat_556]|uniref:helix-turn-helix transcriptional regulator n=1 Tax=Chamaesiphon sp. OTE_75_metabat_556 TaxID=2964692 RepID=UPI00286B666E|nr:helix-turn-helix transcriptional regulator [Chamaesiphon sp. OTE_75_metabat_556]